jgi:5'-nucleotidase
MNSERPLILVTNDDGITAPGISCLVEAAKKFGDVLVIAPDKPQSGMGHAITINSTIRITESKFHKVPIEYACTGTPVDCVKIAVNKLVPRRPALVVSGINHGSNMSVNVIYSGTMSAAVEGAIEGIPSIGFSLCDHDINADFTAASAIVEKIIEKVLVDGMPDGVCLNVNIPPLTADEIKGIRVGIRVCRQARANWVEELDERFDPSGKPYYWLTGVFKNFEPGDESTDVWALDNGYVSIVPVQFDMTNYKYLDKLKTLNYETGIE